MYQILSESAKFCKRDDENIWAYFLSGHSIGILIQHDFQFLQGSVATQFRWGGKHYNCVLVNILWNIKANNYENRSIFTELFEKKQKGT